LLRTVQHILQKQQVETHDRGIAEQHWSVHLVTRVRFFVRQVREYTLYFLLISSKRMINCHCVRARVL